ncbi:MAG: ABC transporter substrate-binding protein [candidate division Zixibacteria bacterium]|nr:ABC transporter substrate-binding protein [candidate division Zixibacteria bacterium]
MKANIQILAAALILCLIAGSVMAQFGTEMVYYELNKPQRNLNPISANDLQVFRIDELIFDALYSWDPQGNIIPQMAQGLPKSIDDGKGALVMLKNNLKWPDSSEITVDDVILTFTKKYTEIDDTRRRLELIKSVNPGEAPNSIIFKFERKVAHPERLLANIFILPSKKLDTSKKFSYFCEHPMGAGPYGLDNISISRNSYYFIKNPNYSTIAAGRPLIDRVKLMYWWSKAAWIPNILDGVVDILPGMEFNPELSSKPRIISKPVNTNTVAMILINTNDPVLKNIDIRNGLQHIISRNDIYDKKYFGDSTLVLTGPYSPASHFFNYKVPSWVYSPEKAHSLFRKSGLLTVNNGKVMNKKDNKQWKLSLKTFITAAGERENLRDALEAVNSYLYSGGINSKIEYLPMEGYVRALEKGDFQLIYMEITFDDNFDIEPYFSSSAIRRNGGRNYGGYSNSKVDKAFAQLSKSSVPQEQQNIGKEIHQLLHDDPPALFLWNLLKWSYVRMELEDVNIMPFYFFSTIDQWKKKAE